MKYEFPMVGVVICEKLSFYICRCVDILRSYCYNVFWGIKSGAGCRFFGSAIIRTRRQGTINLGKNVVFVSRHKMNLVGLMNKTIIDTRGGGHLIVGDRSGFSSVVISTRSSISIGKDVKCGGNVRIFDHDFHSLDPECRRGINDRLFIRTKPIIIGDDCFIGTNSIILKGTELGPRTIVAAGSVVFGLKTPPDSLVKGNPAVVVKMVAN